ncbi:MAG: endodeoxyribonuclease [Desulfovibrionaceae bacterium]|nr:MAG: endodeoxyribonuclease [Desulfovibrionaceae bacterium]
MAVIELRLPWPVSTNKAWKPMGKNRMRLNPKAQLFRLAVKSYVLAAKIQGLPLQGHLEAKITLCPPNRAKRDQDNFAGKTLLDALTKAGLWGDDSQIKRTVIEWADVVKGGAVVIHVKPFVQEVAVTEAVQPFVRMQA